MSVLVPVQVQTCACECGRDGFELERVVKDLNEDLGKSLLA